ncbi:hypothetical protein KKA14_12675 [bacterium]|nr:hypothetical protein [bacterium]
MTLNNPRCIIHCNKHIFSSLIRVVLFLSLFFHPPVVFAAQEPTDDSQQVFAPEEAGDFTHIINSVLGKDPSIFYTSPLKESTAEFASGSSIQLGLGQKNNVLEDYNNFHDSVFSYISADVFFIWKNTNDRELFISGYVENTDYSDIYAEGAKQKIFALLKGETPVYVSSIIGIQLTLDYQQSLDSLNTVSKNQLVPVVINHEISVKPFWEKKIKREIYTIIEFEWSSNSAELPDDSYEKAVLSAAVKKNYGFDSEFLMKYNTSRFTYEKAEALALDESPIVGTELVLDSHSIDLTSKHFWDQSKKWDLESSLGYKRQKDNGAGYDDFENYVLSETLQYKGIYWMLRGSIELSNYLYGKRVVQVDGSKIESEYSHLIYIDIELARSLGNGYSIITALKMNHSTSNNKMEDYSYSSMIIKTEKLF